MNNELTLLPSEQSISRIRRSSDEIREQRNAVYEVMVNAMVEGLDYGKIPGTPKPTLLKPGSEKLLSMFNFSAHPVVEDLSDDDKVHYRVRVIIKHIQTGFVLGEGIGEASSDESKYRWRKSVCVEEWDETPPDRRRTKWGNGQNGPYSIRQVRAEKDDIANTILKMSKKRAQIDAVLTVTAASEIFGQDEEFLEKAGFEAVGAEGDAFVTREEANAWTTSVKESSIPQQAARVYLRDVLKVETSLQMKKHQLDKAKAWVIEEAKKYKADEKKEASKGKATAPASEAKKAEEKPAEATQTVKTAHPVEERKPLTPEEEALHKNIEAGFSALGFDLIQQANLREEYKDNLQALNAELGRLLDEGSAD